MNQDASNNSTLTIVSGIPRSGTSLAMQLLNKVGKIPFTSNAFKYPKNINQSVPRLFTSKINSMNPKGFFESKFTVKSIHSIEEVNELTGYDAVKIMIRQLANALKFIKTSNRKFKLLFCLRDPLEIIYSHRRWFETKNTKSDESEATFVLLGWLNLFYMEIDKEKNLFILDYNNLMKHPRQVLRELTLFLDITISDHELNKLAKSCIDEKLYRSPNLSLNKKLDSYLYKMHKLIKKKRIDPELIPSSILEFIKINKPSQPTRDITNQQKNKSIINIIDQSKINQANQSDTNQIDQIALNTYNNFQKINGNTKRPNELLREMAAESFHSARIFGYDGKFSNWFIKIKNISSSR